MKRLLAEDGSIIVHLDYHVIHYAKILLDEVFGRGLEDNASGYRNEIIYCYSGGGIPKTEYPRKHDKIGRAHV